MPFNAPPNQGFANYYRQANPINKLQGQMGPQAEVPQNLQMNQPAINPGAASISPTPEMLNRLMSQAPQGAPQMQGLPPGQVPMQRPPMPAGPPQGMMPQPQGMMPQIKRPMPTANGRMGY